ncbi:hypothetical protein CR513_38902, partial [Mucuna pruriens]
MATETPSFVSIGTDKVATIMTTITIANLLGKATTTPFFILPSPVNILVSIDIYLSLALQIIKLYPNLVDTVNQDGLSPLQVLAGKPNCFRSSTRMELLQRIVYTCKILTFFPTKFFFIFIIIRSRCQGRI